VVFALGEDRMKHEAESNSALSGGFQSRTQSSLASGYTPTRLSATGAAPLGPAQRRLLMQGHRLSYLAFFTSELI
jgi:hypothetical protein